MLVIRAGIHKMLVRIANRKTLIRLLSQKQSDLGLHCLSMPFWCSKFQYIYLYLLKSVKYNVGMTNGVNSVQNSPNKHSD